jgi:hypothetical protein
MSKLDSDVDHFDSQRYLLKSKRYATTQEVQTMTQQPATEGLIQCVRKVAVHL